VSNICRLRLLVSKASISEQCPNVHLNSSKDSVPSFEDDDYSNEDFEQATDAPTNDSESNDSLVTVNMDVSNDSD
jgi:hypothetical protein